MIQRPLWRPSLSGVVTGHTLARRPLLPKETAPGGRAPPYLAPEATNRPAYPIQRTPASSGRAGRPFRRHQIKLSQKPSPPSLTTTVPPARRREPFGRFQAGDQRLEQSSSHRGPSRRHGPRDDVQRVYERFRTGPTGRGHLITDRLRTKGRPRPALQTHLPRRPRQPLGACPSSSQPQRHW